MYKKNEYIKKTIIWLKMYESLKASIENMEEDIKKEKECGNIAAVDFAKERISETYKFNSVVENESIENIDRIYLLEKKIEMTKYTLNKIDRAMKVLPEPERKLIEIKYIKSEYNTWDDVVKEVGYSKIHCRTNINKRALEKISVAIYGIDAMQHNLAV